MKYGLEQNILQKFQQLFSKYEMIERVILFGSRAKGNHREGSDIDLTIVGENVDATHLLTIQHELDDLLIPYKIDLSVYDLITNEELKDHIQRVGKLFYQKKS
jgi:predicted nucleotidyltransferase